MEILKSVILTITVCLCANSSESAKINSARVLLPWFENLYVNFTFEIIEGGCYTWSLSRDDIIDIEPLYEDTWGHCSRAARVSVSKTCVPPGSVVILAEEVNTGEKLRGDVDINKITSLKVTSTTWKLYLEEAPEAFEVVAYDDQGNKFSTLEGVNFIWTIENLGNENDDPLLTLVNWRDTDYEAPQGVIELESKGLRSNFALLYGQAMGESRVAVCLSETNICTDFNLHVVASVVLLPANAIIAPHDTLRYKVVKAHAGRLIVQDIVDTLYYVKLPETNIAVLEDSVSLVRGTEIGTTNVLLMSGTTQVASATITVAQPHSIKIKLRPYDLVIRGEPFVVHCIALDNNGHALTAGEKLLIRLTVDGEANVDLLRSTENGTLTDAVAQNAGPFTITASLYSVAGMVLSEKVEGTVSAEAVEPLEVVPPELFVAWTDNIQEIQLKHRGGGDAPVTWSLIDSTQNSISLTPTGLVTVRGLGSISVQVQLKRFPFIRATGRILSAVPELVQLSSSGHARVGRPHHLHIALTATHPETGELYNFHVCNCASFTVSLLEGPEPQNVTAAPWVQPVEGACCAVQCSWASRGVCGVRAARGRAGAAARVLVRAAPRLVWPPHVAALAPHSATLPVLAEGEELVPHSIDPRVAELTSRTGPAPQRYPDIQLFTVKCRRKGESRLELTSQTEDEFESVEFVASCAPHVSKIRLEPPVTPGNCSGGPRLWLRPGHEVTLKVTLYDAVGRELLDERGPKVTWEFEPKHVGLEYKAVDRLFVETHPDYAPVPVPYKYYQLVVADEQAIGWTGSLKASIPEATASIQLRVVAPLKCDPVKVDIAWESESVANITTITGGSGRYAVEGPKGVTATVEKGRLSAFVSGPGTYDLLVTDLCVHGEKQYVEVHIEEILSVEVSTSRAVCVGGCVPISALVKGVSHRYLSSSHEAEWRVTGHVTVTDGRLCGLSEGSGTVRASLGGVWSPEFEVAVFPPLRVVPGLARVPPGARLQLRPAGGPPAHLASLHYALLHGDRHVEVSPTGSVYGVSMGTARIRLVAKDISNMEMASAESEIQVIPISGLRVRTGTSTLAVGSAAPLWLEAGALPPAALLALQPPPHVTWALRDPNAARIYTTHQDDFVERSVAEGLSVRVVPFKPGVITIDVRVRNLGQVAETRSWDSTIEILGISDIRASVDGLSNDLVSGDRLAVAVGSTVRLKSMPRSTWKAYGDGSFEMTPNGELKAIKPGFGVVVAQHRDETNNIDRETAVHVEVAVPVYCTVEPAAEGVAGGGPGGPWGPGGPGGDAVRVVPRSALGRRLLAPAANISAAPLPAVPRKLTHSAYGDELVIVGLEAAGAFMTFHATISGVTVKDEVWVTGSDSYSSRIVAGGGWAVCVEGVGWRSSSGGVRLAAGGGVTLALLTRPAPAPAAHPLTRDRPAPAALTIHQVPLDKVTFFAGEWPSAMVPLSIEASIAETGPILCTEDQRYAMEGVQIELPFTCLTKPPHSAQAVMDIINGQVGCSVIPAGPINEASEVELCAEWGALRTCTKVLLLPPIKLSKKKLSLLDPPAMFIVSGHPHALKHVKMTTSPGLKLESTTKNGEITVSVKSDVVTPGIAWVNVISKLTSQDMRVEVEMECDESCGTLLGAIFTFLLPYFPTLLTLFAVAAAYLYIQAHLQRKVQVRMPTEPPKSVLPATSTPPLARQRTWSRSPYANGPAAPVYGDATMLPDNSFSPNSSRMHSRFL